MKTLAKLVGLQVLTIPFVIMIFKFSPSNKIGGVIAGCVFLTLSFYILYTLKKKFSNWLKMFTFYGVMVHLFVAVIPMMSTRLYNWSSDFSEYSVLGVKAEVFHQISERIYVLMVFCTLLDLVLKFREKGRLTRASFGS